MNDTFSAGSTLRHGAAITTYINAVILTDWRQYEGTQTIELSPRDDRTLNAIIGDNGTGKTGLAKAVSACLNGTVPAEDVTDGEPYVNSEKMKGVSPGESVTGSITLRLTHQETQFDITRRFTSTKQETGCENIIDDELEVSQYVAGEGWKPVEKPDSMLARILPPEVQRYYFFDGERLDQLFKPGYEAKVRTAILELSHIEVLERGIDHLGKLRNERRRKARRESGEVTDAEAKEASRLSELVDIAHEKASVERRITMKADALSEVEDQMGAASDPDVLDLIRKRASLEERIDRLREMEVELNRELNNHLVETGTIVLAADALEAASEHLDRLDAKGHLPPDVRRGYLTNHLEQGECICGCNLDKHPTRRTKVEELRDSTPDISERTIEASYEFPKTQLKGAKRFQKLTETKGELRKTRQERLKTESEHDEVSSTLRAKEIPEGVDIAGLEEQRGQLRAELDTLQNRNGRLAERLGSKDAELEAARERLERELAKDQRNDRLMREVELYRQGQHKLKVIKNGLMEQVRTAIETSLNQYFNGLMWKDEPIEVTLDESFSIHLQGPEGIRQVQRLSAGETELLALSFIAALTEVSGFDAPVLIDTPVGRIDEEHRASIADKLPRYLAGHQLTFLFTDSEYDDVVASGLEQRLAHKYRLENDNRVTRVTRDESMDTPHE